MIEKTRKTNRIENDILTFQHHNAEDGFRCDFHKSEQKEMKISNNV